MPLSGLDRQQDVASPQPKHRAIVDALARARPTGPTSGWPPTCSASRTTSANDHLATNPFPISEGCSTVLRKTQLRGSTDQSVCSLSKAHNIDPSWLEATADINPGITLSSVLK